MQNQNIVVSRLPAAQKKAVQVAILHAMQAERAAKEFKNSSDMVMADVVAFAESGMTPERAASAMQYVKDNGGGDKMPVSDSTLENYYCMAIGLCAYLDMNITTGETDKGGKITRKVRDRLIKTNKKNVKTGRESLRKLYNLMQGALVKSLPADKQKARIAEQEKKDKVSRQSNAKSFITKAPGKSLIAKLEQSILELVGATIAQAVEAKVAEKEVNQIREMLHQYQDEFGIKLN